MVKFKAAEAEVSWDLVSNISQVSNALDPTFPMMQLNDILCLWVSLQGKGLCLSQAYIVGSHAFCTSSDGH